MKIAFATANLDIHGVATFTLNLGRWLQAADHDVTVITVTYGAWWSRLAELGIKGECINQQPWDNVVSHIKRLAAWLTEQAFDLLVVNVGSIYSRPLQLCLHFLPDPLSVVILLHNAQLDVYDVAGLNGAAWNCAVGVSPRVQQTAAARFAHKAVHCIPNGVELPTDYQLSARLDWATPLRLLFVSRLDDQQKGIFRLPAILAVCRKRRIPVRLTVIGDGPDRTQLTQLLMEAGVADLVELCGFQAHDSVLAAMRTHHILLMPSNYEGLPIVLLEAQANGCVPIAARLPDITDLALAEGVSGILVNPDDVSGYVNGIEKLLMREQWRAFHTAGIEVMQQHFSLQSMGVRYVSLFEEICRGAYPLPIARSVLRQQGISPIGWRDYLPQPVRTRLHKIVPTARKLTQQLWGNS